MASWPVAARGYAMRGGADVAGCTAPCQIADAPRALTIEFSLVFGFPSGFPRALVSPPRARHINIVFVNCYRTVLSVLKCVLVQLAAWTLVA